jgi:hypothetical protein
VESLKTAGITAEEFVFPKNKLVNIQNQLEKLVSKSFELHTLAKDGFRLVTSIAPHAHLPLHTFSYDENLWSVLLIAA